MDFGIIGYPLGHSFSPDYFNAKFRELQLFSHHYYAFPIESITELPTLIQQNSELSGLSVTIPYKESIFKLLTFKSKEVIKIGACNCVKIIRASDKYELHGFNTDIIGFEKSLQNLIGNSTPKALVLGSGGASKAAQYVLRKMGLHYQIVSRKDQVGYLSYESLDESIMSEYQLIINTTPLGMSPEISSKPEIPYQFLSSQHFLFDMVYNPHETSFLLEGKKLNCRIKNGLEMLHYQAEAAWEIWKV